jgi:uncharacterized membrane protein
MPADAAFCPGCGRPMRTELRTETTAHRPEPDAQAETSAPRRTSADGKVGPLSANLAGALAYFTFVPAVVFLFVVPYRKDRFARFHAIQCLLFSGAVSVLGVVLWLAGLGVLLIPRLGPLVVAVVDVVVALAAMFLWLVLVVKAFQGEMFKLPVLGDFAERHSGGA